MNTRAVVVTDVICVEARETFELSLVFTHQYEFKTVSIVAR